MPKGQILYDPTYVRHPAQSNSQRQKVGRWFLEAGQRANGEVVFGGHSVAGGADRKVLDMDTVRKAELRGRAQCHGTVRSKTVKMVNFVLCFFNGNFF